jgi:hypothetical protein
VLKQPSLFEFTPDVVLQAVEKLSKSPSEDRGAVFTKRPIVDFILDLAGYVTTAELLGLRILEPSFGNGDFLFPIVDRLLGTIPLDTRKDPTLVARLAACIRGVELHQETFADTQRKLIAKLIDSGFRKADSEDLARSWLRAGDFLLTEFDASFDMVVGNPPYLRLERIPEALLLEYRKRFSTLYDRADLYIPFIEHSLNQVSSGGKLCFICADRWMKNRYGGPLRKMVAESFKLTAYASITGVNAFQQEVTAYPAITLISREASGPTRVASIKSIDTITLGKLAKQLTSKRFTQPSEDLQQLENVTKGSAPWLLESSTNLDVVRRLEALYPTLEEAGCKVGIGVATGADKVYIGPYDSLDVEEARKLPLAMTKDIASGVVDWRGFGVVNPYEVDGTLASLDDYPRFKKYLLERKSQITARHVAKKTPISWYRTIDRIHPDLARTPKLLIPDIKGEANVVYESGTLYPHHNLYYITAQDWDLHALKTVLSSGIARLFVATYTTKMRGGYFRFQAQYLRRIRLPEWKSVPAKTKRLLIETCSIANPEACNEAVSVLYGISKEERNLLGWQ